MIALIIQPYVRDQELEPDQESLHDAAREKASRLLEGSRTIAPDSSKSKSPVIRDFGDTDRYKGRR